MCYNKQAKTHIAIIVVTVKNRCFNQVQLGKHEIGLVQISSDLQEVSSGAVRSKI